MPDQTPQDLPCYNHPIRHSGHHIHLSSSALRDTPINGISTFPSPQSRYWTIRVRIVSSYINTMNAYLDELQLQAVVCGQKCCGGGSLITPGLQAWVPLSHPHLTPQNTFFTYKVGCCKFPDQCCPHHGHSSKCHFKPSCNPDSPERIQAVQDVAQEALLYQQLEQRERQRRAVEGRNRLESVSGPIQRAVAEGLGRILNRHPIENEPLRRGDRGVRERMDIESFQQQPIYNQQLFNISTGEAASAPHGTDDTGFDEYLASIIWQARDNRVLHAGRATVIEQHWAREGASNAIIERQRAVNTYFDNEETLEQTQRRQDAVNESWALRVATGMRFANEEEAARQQAVNAYFNHEETAEQVQARQDAMNDYFSSED